MQNLWLKSRWIGLFLSSFFAFGCVHTPIRNYKNGFRSDYSGNAPFESVVVQDGLVERTIKVGPLQWDEVPPAKEWFLSIYAENYLIHYYDCSNKSSKYARILKYYGYNPTYLVLKTEGGYHAILSIEYKNKVLYLDVTNGISTCDFSFDTVVLILPYEYILKNEFAVNGNHNVDIGSVNWRRACKPRE